MVHGSWLMAQGSWLMAKGGRPDPGAQGGGGAGLDLGPPPWTLQDKPRQLLSARLCFSKLLAVCTCPELKKDLEVSSNKKEKQCRLWLWIFPMTKSNETLRIRTI